MTEPLHLNFVNSFMQGREAGREIRRQKVTDNALAKYASGDTQGGYNDLLTVDPDAAFGLQDRTRQNEQYGLRKRVGSMVAGGDYAGAQKAAAEGGDFDVMGSISQLDATQRAQAKESAQMIGAVGIRLLETPYEQRKAALATMRESFIEKGYPPEQIDQVIADPSDAVLNGIIGQSMTIKDAIDYSGQQYENRRTSAQTEYYKAGVGVRDNQADYYGAKADQPYAPRAPKAGKPAAGANPVLAALEAELRRRGKL